MNVKLKSTGRTGVVLMHSAENSAYRHVAFKPEGKECTRTKSKVIVQLVRHDNFEEVKEN